MYTTWIVLISVVFSSHVDEENWSVKLAPVTKPAFLLLTFNKDNTLGNCLKTRFLLLCANLFPRDNNVSNIFCMFLWWSTLYTATELRPDVLRYSVSHFRCVIRNKFHNFSVNASPNSSSISNPTKQLRIFIFQVKCIKNCQQGS